jgi:hypothetical protein
MTHRSRAASVCGLHDRYGATDLRLAAPDDDDDDDDDDDAAEAE